jgi:hypothetical protein
MESLDLAKGILISELPDDGVKISYLVQSLRWRPILFVCVLLSLASVIGPMARSERIPDKSQQDYTNNVDPFIGVDWGGLLVVHFQSAVESRKP